MHMAQGHDGSPAEVWILVAQGVEKGGNSPVARGPDLVECCQSMKIHFVVGGAQSCEENRQNWLSLPIDPPESIRRDHTDEGISFLESLRELLAHCAILWASHMEYSGY